MFESTPIIDARSGGVAQGDDSPMHRRFAWEELVARLAATRDVRTVLADMRPTHGGSFLVADSLLGKATQNSGSTYESAVNPVGLTDGKAGEAWCAEAAADAAHVDREAQ